MEISDKYYDISKHSINGKTYLVAHHDLKGCKYFQRKVPTITQAYKQRKFYSTEEMKSMENKLTCGIKKKNYKNTEIQKVEQKKNQQQEKTLKVTQEKIIRPSLAAEGPTHFINISVSNQLREIYLNAIQPTIAEQTLPLESLHINLLSFRLRKDDDLEKWASILKDIKKKKISIKGIGMHGQKDRFARIIYLNVQGIDDIVDTIVGKALDRKLIQQNQLQKIRFDKKSQTYKSEQGYITILKTQGKDLVDAKEYLATFKSLFVGPFPVTQFKISIVGSFKQQRGYYHDKEILL